MYRYHQFGEARVFASHPMPGEAPKADAQHTDLPRFWTCNPFLAAKNGLATRPQSNSESKPFGKEGREHSISQPGFLCIAPSGNFLLCACHPCPVLAHSISSFSLLAIFTLLDWVMLVTSIGQESLSGSAYSSLVSSADYDSN